MPLIQNERHKLTANALNGVAIATMVAGSVAPLIAASYGFSGAPADRFLAFVTAGWFSQELPYISSRGWFSED